jgi:pyruvate,water dikinase
MIPIFPRLLRNHVALWRDDAFPGYKKVVDEWRQRNPAELSSRELLDGAREVFAAAIDHLTKMQVATLGVAASSEGIFTATYNKLVKRAEDPNAPTYLIGLDSAPLRAEKSLFDLAAWCRENPGLAAALLREPADEIVARLQGDTAPEGVDALAWVEFRQRFQDHLARYGYAIFDLDFAKPLPMDDPAPMIEVLKLYLSGQGQDPYARQEAATQRREAATRAARARLKGLIAWAFEKSLRWAQTDLPMREDSIAEIGMGYPVIRALLRELGRRLAEAGALATPKEVYWLKGAELEQAVTALEQSSVLPDFTAPIAERRAHWRVLKGVNPPHQLPVDAKLLGMKMDAFMGVHAGNEAGDVIRGLGASPGKVTATARVLHGPEDFDQMRPGDVLVAAITTPAWTPLFAMASAVVTDIGGPLSHGSIVAREYGIPAVLGTGVATRRIQSGQTVTVDGAQGSITLGAVDETPA